MVNEIEMNVRTRKENLIHRQGSKVLNNPNKNEKILTYLWSIRLTIKAAERQNAAPLALLSAYSSYSASSKWRSAAAIAKIRGSRKSKGAPDIVQASLLDTS